MLAQQISFTFETVMSHCSKIDILMQAQATGYRTYLYFVATDDSTINISRVRNRVKLGGHDVPADKIEARYYRTPIGLTSLTTLATAKTANKHGWQRSPKAGNWS